MQKTKPYDDDQLAQDIAEARLSMTQIAAKHGLSLSLLYRIASGRRRPNILRRIATIWRLTHGDVRRMCAANVKKMLDIHLQTGRSDKGHNGRQCREYILSHVLRRTGLPPLGAQDAVGCARREKSRDFPGELGRQDKKPL